MCCNNKVTKREGVQILEEQMKAIDPNENEIYKFSGCEQVERIDMKKGMERIQIKREQRTRKLKIL